MYADTTSMTRVIRIAAPDKGGVSLGLLQHRSDRIDPRLPPVLLLHGATLGACVFDLGKPGYSLMATLASAGRAVYAVDIRGYGASRRGTIVDEELNGHAPFPRIADAVSDIGAAVNEILSRERADAVDLVGFSWGSVSAARYAAQHPEHIARLVLYAPLYGEVNPTWLERIADPHDRSRLRAGVGAYRFMTLIDLTHRWNSEITAADKSIYREPGVVEAAFDAMAAHDAETRSGGLPAYRCPSGALADLVDIFNGRPLYDARRLTMPTLLVRGAEDTTSTDTDTRRLLAAIPSPAKRYAIIAPGSHFLLLERNRLALYGELDDFFAPMTLRRSIGENTL
jgi:pimeloyl-ACP methyl ester carboxylesterase